MAYTSDMSGPTPYRGSLKTQSSTLVCFRDPFKARCGLYGIPYARPRYVELSTLTDTVRILGDAPVTGRVIVFSLAHSHADHCARARSRHVHGAARCP